MRSDTIERPRITEYELLYPWHPWAGCLVHIHEVVEKAGREVFRCSLSGRASGRWLEIPAWMFDRAARAAWRVDALMRWSCCPRDVPGVVAPKAATIFATI